MISAAMNVWLQIRRSRTGGGFRASQIGPYITLELTPKRDHVLDLGAGLGSRSKKNHSAACARLRTATPQRPFTATRLAIPSYDAASYG